MIVRLDLEANRIGFVERDHARVVREDRQTEWLDPPIAPSAACVL